MLINLNQKKKKITWDKTITTRYLSKCQKSDASFLNCAQIKWFLSANPLESDIYDCCFSGFSPVLEIISVSLDILEALSQA